MKRINYFKTALIVLGIIFIYVLYNYSENGRYQFYQGDNPYWMIDTKTGNIYSKGELYFKKR
jgi:hypothetical protein